MELDTGIGSFSGRQAMVIWSLCRNRNVVAITWLGEIETLPGEHTTR
jgi:hypothetical protein